MIKLKTNSYLRFRGAIVKAHYRQAELAKWKGNPFAEALPPVINESAQLKFMAVPPTYRASDRSLDTELRLHLLSDLRRFLVPHGKHHLDLSRKFSLLIRGRYELNNPISIHYPAYITGNEYQPPTTLEYDLSTGMCIFGISGSGKTLGVQRALSFYPQVIIHDEYYRGIPLSLYQVVWLKLDCPRDARIKGLCINFFRSIDTLIPGANTLEIYGNNGEGNDTFLISGMQQVAKLVHLGALVIDETQLLYALMHGRQGGLVDRLILDLVELENGIGAPIVFMGTPLAQEVLSTSLVIARRASSFGDIEVEILNDGTTDWTTFSDVLWGCQYTAKEIVITNGLRSVLFDESQGIPAIAVAIYTGAQYRAITSGAEKITEQMLRQIIKEDYPRLVKPLEKLRKSNERKFENEEDYKEYEEAYSVSFKETMDYKELGLNPPSPAPSQNKGSRRTSALPLKGK